MRVRGLVTAVHMLLPCKHLLAVHLQMGRLTGKVLPYSTSVRHSTESSESVLTGTVVYRFITFNNDSSVERVSMASACERESANISNVCEAAGYTVYPDCQRQTLSEVKFR